MANTYNAARIRDLKRAEIAGKLLFGPWGLTNGWYNLPSWRIWKRFNSATLTVEETLTETDSNASPDSPLHPGININETKYVVSKTYEFTATVPFVDFWRGAIGDKPSDKSFWNHWSRTAYGSGLYHAAGQIIILGESTEHVVEREIFIPYTGPGYDDVRVDLTRPGPSSYSMEYESDPAELNGLLTPCRMTADQYLHSSRGFNDGGIDGERLYTPWETDPDGNTGNEIDGWAAELYFSDTTLAMLASGSWTADMQLVSGAVSKDFTDGGWHRKSFSRSGHFVLTFA